MYFEGKVSDEAGTHLAEKGKASIQKTFTLVQELAIGLLLFLNFAIKVFKRLFHVKMK